VACTPSKLCILIPDNMPSKEIISMEGQMEITQDMLVGTWKLLAFKITEPDGTTKNWGPNSNGLLIYDKAGYMSTSINSGAEPAVIKNNLEKNILFYSGKYKLKGKNQIKHYVTNASDPSRVNKNFIRNAQFTKDKQLHLTAEGAYGQAYLLWEKV